MVVLKRAVAEGWRKASSRPDPDLDALRSRDDFRLLVFDLDFPENPLARDR